MSSSKPAEPADPATQYALDVCAGRIIAGPHVRDACARHLRDLEEGPSRGLTWDTAAAERSYRYFSTVLRLNGGEHEGSPFDLHPSQQFIVGSLFGWKRAGGTRRFRVAFIEQGKGNGKALALDTPVPTPAGWSTMGELQPGDLVFDAAGSPTEVVGVSEIMVGNPCYQVVFDDGEVIVADAEHLWFTEQRTRDIGAGVGSTKGEPRAERGRWRKGIRTTVQIAATLRYPNGKYQSVNHSIPLCGPLDLAPAELPIEPYTLGVWLGDGDSDCARITCQDDPEILEHLTAAGTAVGQSQISGGRAARYRIGSTAAARDSLSARLRRADLLHNKHIPAPYLRASREQRLALLQGLMDTDGHISPKNGQCEFTTTTEALAVGIRELLHSLGLKSGCGTGDATIGGRFISRKWRVTFFAPAALPVFRLSRKARHHFARHARRRLSADRRIVDCRPVESVPVRCIKVAAPDGLFLAGRSMVPTHNTPLAAGIGHLMTGADGESRAETYAAATDKEQAGILFRDAVAMAKQSPGLLRRVKFSGGEGREYNIAYLASGSFFRPISSESSGKGKSGFRPHCALLDEIHEHPTNAMVEFLRGGTKGRRQALIFMITNSGVDRESVCFEYHTYAAKVAAGEIQDDSFFGYVCALDEGEDPFEDPVDPELGFPRSWVKANPLIGVTFPPSYLEEQVRQARGMPSKESIVRRLNFCEWVDAVNPWIDGDMWRSCEVEELPPLPPNPILSLSLDLSAKRDLTAAGRVFELEDGRLAAELRFWTPADSLQERERTDRVPYSAWVREGHLIAVPGRSIDYGFVVKEISDWLTADQASLAFDPYRISDFQRALDDAGIESWVAEWDEKRETWVEEGEKSPGQGLRLMRHGQGYGGGANPNALWMPRSITHTEDAILNQRVLVRKNPVLTWCSASAIVEQDAAENKKWSKRKSTGRIDGIVALSMAIGLASLPPVQGPSYDIMFLGGGA